MKLLKTMAIITLLIVFSTACTSTKTTTYWVNSMKKECDAGAGKTTCLQVYKGDIIEKASWTYFYTPIEGFAFEPGFFQRIEVSETAKEKANTPADASSKAYKLIKVLEKIQDFRMALHDIWAVTHINDEAITTTENVPSLEINTTKMKVYGTDGCNNYTGDIKNITSEKISFGALASSRKMCFDMDIPNKFNQALNNSVSYKIDNLSLHFYDGNRKKTLTFKKVD